MRSSHDLLEQGSTLAIIGRGKILYCSSGDAGGLQEVLPFN